MAQTTVDYNKPIPSPEDVSPELRGLLEREVVLRAEAESIEQERREIDRINAAEKYADDRKHAIDALITGSSFSPSADVRDRIATLVKRAGIVKDALHEISALIRVERVKASSMVAAQFKPEQAHMAAEFFKHLAAAARIHSEFGAMRLRIERAGYDSGGLHDFARDLMGVPGKRADSAGFILRDGVRRGYIREADVPVEYV